MSLAKSLHLSWPLLPFDLPDDKHWASHLSVHRGTALAPLPITHPVSRIREPAPVPVDGGRVQQVHCRRRDKSTSDPWPVPQGQGGLATLARTLQLRSLGPFSVPWPSRLSSSSCSFLKPASTTTKYNLLTSQKTQTALRARLPRLVVAVRCCRSGLSGPGGLDLNHSSAT